MRALGRPLVAAALVALLPACKRAAPPPPTPASASAAEAEAPPPAPTTPSDEEPSRPPRRFVASSPEDSGLLRPHAETLRAQFGPTPGPLDVMAAPGTDGRVLLLVGSRSSESPPIVLVTDARRSLLWKKERPLAGTRRGGRHASIAGGPRGDVLITWCDEGSGALAARKWEASGGLMADYQLLPSAGCDALSSLYWPGEGWVVVASLLGVGRAQLLGENGALRWGREGASVGRGFRAPTPQTLIPDTARSVIVLGYGYAELGGGDRVVAWRMSLEGQPLFRVELGEAPSGGALPFVDAERVEPGVVRATWGRERVELTSAGQVRVAR